MTDGYRPLDDIIVRVPLLPFGVFDDRARPDAFHLTDEVRTAIAVGSADFDDALDLQPGDRAAATLRRYLTRMSTRPTPFGLFAGVALAHQGTQTTLQLQAGARPRRTRPDAARLAAFTISLEQDPSIRSQLTVVANSAARHRAGRIVLAEREGAEGGPVAVSVRATGVVRRALAAARAPIRHADLVDLLITQTPGADRRRVQALLAELCRQTLLLTELRVSPVDPDRAHVLHRRLSALPAAAEAAERLGALLATLNDLDAGPPAIVPFREAVGRAAALAPAAGQPLQVDSGLHLTDADLAEQVALEAARAADLLLRISPTPQGPSHLSRYRRAFESRYGSRGEVSLLELLDPITGLGPPPPPEAGRLDQRRSVMRAAALTSLATDALRDHSACVELDEEHLRRLETADEAARLLPVSVELTVSVAAASRSAIDNGEFDLVIGPNVGSAAAGRMLGRFADLVPGARDALDRIAGAESAVAPGVLFAELSYAPRSARQINVATRPSPRSHEIAVDVFAANDPAHTIPLDELVVFVREGRFRIGWSATGQEVVVTAGHMLNSANAPVLARFLSEIGRDGRCQLAGFSWGPAAAFPYLPRVRSGRVVLALAQWRLDPVDLDPSASGAGDFTDLLGRWRERWRMPARVALASGDRRLALDLSRPADRDELRRAIRSTRRTLTLTELYPDAADLWLTDGENQRYAAEFVVPLVRRAVEREPPRRPPGSPIAADRRPPGSDWLYLKLYTGSDLEDQFLAGPLRELIALAESLGATGAFFLRFDDPDRHVRVRFRGTPELLMASVLPRVAGLANRLLTSGDCRRWVIDTYERELARFGGPAGTDAVERFFAADSAVVLALLAEQADDTLGLTAFPLAVLTIDALADGFGLDLVDRARWCADRGGPRRESGVDYRTFKAGLRPLITESPGRSDPTVPALDSLRRAAAGLRADLDELAAAGRLTCLPTDLLPSLTHLHLNRLIAASRITERRVYGLLARLCGGLAAPRSGA